MSGNYIKPVPSHSGLTALLGGDSATGEYYHLSLLAYNYFQSFFSGSAVVSATTFFSGSTNLNDLFSQSNGVLSVSAGANAMTGGTDQRPVISVVGSPVFTAVTANSLSGGTIYSGGTDLSHLLGQGGQSTYVQAGSNITTGGTAFAPIINVSGSPVFTAVTANSVSGGTIYSGNTELSTLFPKTFVQAGLNITTGGTAFAPIVNTSGFPVFTAVTTNSISASTIYSGGVDVSRLFSKFPDGTGDGDLIYFNGTNWIAKDLQLRAEGTDGFSFNGYVALNAGVPDMNIAGNAFGSGLIGGDAQVVSVNDWDYSWMIGGYANQMYGDIYIGTILGSYGSVLWDVGRSMILGGTNVTMSGGNFNAVVAGGGSDLLNAERSVDVGSYGTIFRNVLSVGTLSSLYATNNLSVGTSIISSYRSDISGTTIGGTTAEPTSDAMASSIIGGKYNILKSSFAVIVGGSGNTMNVGAVGSVIAAGSDITADEAYTLYTNRLRATGSVDAQSMSAITFYSGGTDLSHLLGGSGGSGATTYVQAGLNITTGGTPSSPIVNTSGSPSFTSVTSQSVFATSASATTFYSGSTDLSHLLGQGGQSTFVQAGLNITTGGTAFAPIVNVSGSPSFTAVTASNFISGATNLSSVFAPSSVQNQWIQNGTNTTTGGTPNAPSVNVVASPSFTSVSAVTFYSGSTDISHLFSQAGQSTYVQPGLNITTGGTASVPIVNVSGSPVFTAVTANVITGNTIYSGTSELSTLFPKTFVQAGLNITTGGTAFAPIINVSGSPSFTAVTANSISATTFYSGSSELGLLFPKTFIQAGLNITTGGTLFSPIVNTTGFPVFTAVTANSISATTFYSGGTDLNHLLGQGGQSTFVQNGTNTTTGGTAFLPTVNVVASPSFTSVSAVTFFSGSTDLNELIESSFGGNTTDDFNKFAKFNIEGQLRGSVNNSTTAAVWGQSTGTGYAAYFNSASDQETIYAVNADSGNTISANANYGSGINAISSRGFPLRVQGYDLGAINEDLARFYVGLSPSLRLTILYDGGLRWNGAGSATTRNNIGVPYVVGGTNITTGGTDLAQTVNVVASPSFTSVSAVTFWSGSTNLSHLLGQGGTSTYVQNGTNIQTGGTAFLPTINLVANPVVTSLSATSVTASILSATTQIYSGSSSLGTLLDLRSIRIQDMADHDGLPLDSHYFATFDIVEQRPEKVDGATLMILINNAIDHTYVQNGTNTTTGGTAFLPTVNVVASPSFTSVSAVTFYSGSTNLSHLLGQGGVSTYVQNGTNITTGGTAALPTINLVATPSVTGLIASGTITGNTIQGNTFNHYGETVAGGIYFQTSNALDLSGNITFDGLRVFSRGGMYTHTTGGFTGNTFFSGTTDFNHILTSSVANYFTQSAVTINGNVTITSGLTVSGSSIFIGGIDLSEPEGKNPILWLTFPDSQISGETAFSYTHSASTMTAPRVKADEFIANTYPDKAVIYVDPATNILTGDSALFYYHAPLGTLYAEVYSGGNFHIDGNALIGADIRYAQAPPSTVIYTSGLGDDVLTGSSVFQYSEVTEIMNVPHVSATTVTATTFSVGARTQSDMQSVTLQGTVATSSATPVNATGLSFSVDANSKYSYSFTVVFRSANTATGLGLSVTGPTSPLLISGTWFGHFAAGTGFRHITSYDDLGTGALPTVSVINTDYTAVMQGTLVTGSNAGTLQLRFCRGGSANSVTIMSGSTGFLTKG